MGKEASWVAQNHLPQWVLPFQILLDKYELPESKVILGMGCAMISYISKLKLQKVEGFTEILYREVRGILSKFLAHLKKKGVTPRENFRACSVIKSFTHFNNERKPGTRILDLCYSMKTKVLVEKWNRLNIEDLCPINMGLIVSALNWVVRVGLSSTEQRQS